MQNKKKFIEASETKYGKDAILTRIQIQELHEELKLPYPFWIIDCKIAYNEYKIPVWQDTISMDNVPNDLDILSTPINLIGQSDNINKILTPIIDPFYIQFGVFKDVVSIIKSKIFCPILITGHSGSGKTKLIEQACAKMNRSMIRINVSEDTDEVALLGGQTLQNGNITFKEGPVLTAMREGHILLCDEIDRSRGVVLLCLQSIMEGSNFYNKYTGEIIEPKDGFQIIATANTKGYGATSKYLAQVLDSAFLERFCICIEHEFATEKQEIEILSKYIDDKEFVKLLCRWSSVIRETFKQNAIDDMISTRRLIHIAKIYNIFKNKKKTIEYCVNRFEDDIKNAFLDLYSKIDTEALVD